MYLAILQHVTNWLQLVQVDDEMTGFGTISTKIQFFLDSFCSRSVEFHSKFLSQIRRQQQRG